MKVKYTAVFGNDGAPLLNSRGRIVKRPIVQIELTGKDGSKIEVPALVDSGADTTTLNIQYADYLGVVLNQNAQKEIMGIGKGRVPTFPAVISFRIKGLDESIEVPVWFVDSENVNILLGQEAFFETYRIKFEKDHDTFEIIKSNRT